MAVIGVPPEITAENQPFWDGTAKGELRADRCQACGRFVPPPERLIPRPEGVCPRCGSSAIEWVTVEGPGVIAALTLNYQRWTPQMEVPYALVEVEFPTYEDVVILGRLQGFADLTMVKVGDKVDVGVEEGPDGCMVPSFRPWQGRK